MKLNLTLMIGVFVGGALLQGCGAGSKAFTSSSDGNDVTTSRHTDPMTPAQPALKSLRLERSGGFPGPNGSASTILTIDFADDFSHLHVVYQQAIGNETDPRICERNLDDADLVERLQGYVSQLTYGVEPRMGAADTGDIVLTTTYAVQDLQRVGVFPLSDGRYDLPVIGNGDELLQVLSSVSMDTACVFLY